MMDYIDRPKTTALRIGSIALAALLVVFGLALFLLSLIGAVVLFVGGLGFGSSLFIALGVLSAGLSVFAAFFSLKVLIPFARLLVGED